MKISKIYVPNSLTKTMELEEINLTKKNLGSTVALVGKNGAGKSRILLFVENYIKNITPENILREHFTNIPTWIIKQNEQNFIAGKKLLKNIEAGEYNDAQLTTVNNQLKQFTLGILQDLKRFGKAYIKVVDNDDLKNIKGVIDNNSKISFEQILTNKHFTDFQQNQNSSSILLNEFSEFNSDSTVQYFTKLTNDIITEEFNLYIKNRNNPELINPEIKKNKSFQLFMIFQDYVKRFLGKEFSYQRTATGNTVTSVLHYNNQPFNLSQFSPGQKTLFAYAILFFYLDVNSNTNIRECIIIIDEPEKHLHPEAQVDLITALKSIISKSGQLWIATHSVNILSHLEHDEIIMVQDNKIIPPSRTTPGKSFNELMGLDEHVNKLIEFINSISEWAYGNFMAQCFKEPEVLFGNDPNDPQFILFKTFLENKSKSTILDFGAGKGRIGYTLNEDNEVSKKIEYSAFEPDKGNFELLNKVPNIKKTYSNASSIPDNTFDCVLLCNVLHEILPTDWQSSLETIKRVLKDDGYLLLIEDKFLPKGETAHQFGYLILGSEEAKLLLNTEIVLELKLQEEQYRERILFNAFKKEHINPSPESVINSIKMLKQTSFHNLKLLRKSEKDINHGRRYANETQLFINAKLVLETLE